MSQSDQAFLAQAQQFVKNLLEEKLDDRFTFHNLGHTREVVRNCELLARQHQLPDEDQLALLLAAWFHDTGYTGDSNRPHEDCSQEIAADFFRLHQTDPGLVEKVNNCIMATKMPQSPSSLMEQIICDADLFHLGTDKFEEKSKQLRQEVNAIHSEPINKKEWRRINIEFLQRHRYFTDYAREKLEPVKQKHLEALLARAGKKDKEAQNENSPVPETIVQPLEPVAANMEDLKEKEPEKKEDKDAKDEKAKTNRTERGVVAMFRIMSENHINLSSMADSKANIMISVNTIVISIMVSVLLGKLQFYPEYIIPTIILVGICLAAVVFAILATRPNVSGGTFSKDDIKNKKINLLFFGNFYNMKLEDYDWAMKEMMNDKEYLYGSMIKDMYFLGIVLARKYKFLRISYNIFMFGLVAAILAFVIAFVTSGVEGN